ADLAVFSKTMSQSEQYPSVLAAVLLDIHSDVPPRNLDRIIITHNYAILCNSYITIKPAKK
ncbi:MAG: hypothetical protein ACYCYM_15055, partial [Saccharofermentanales bacterium]